MQIVYVALGTLISHAIVASVDLLVQLAGAFSGHVLAQYRENYRIGNFVLEREREDEKEETSPIHRGGESAMKCPTEFLRSRISVAWGHLRRQSECGTWGEFILA